MVMSHEGDGFICIWLAVLTHETTNRLMKNMERYFVSLL